MAGCRYRIRPGGGNSAQLKLSPQHAEAAPHFIHILTQTMQQLAPERRLEISVPAGQEALFNAAQQAGFNLRYAEHTMGILF